MNSMPVFASPLESLIRQYVEYRRMRGYKSVSGEEDLRQFDVYAAKATKTSLLTKELVEEYITSRPGEKQSTQYRRVSTVRCFGKYLVRCGMDAYVLPYGVATATKYAFVPHVFNAVEAARLMDAADSLPYRANTPRRHIVIPMMLRLIYGCGLRVSEACSLRIRDVDLDSGILYVRSAKFNKDRYVPMSMSLLQKCRAYESQVAEAIDDEEPFLPSQSGGFYHRTTVGYAFRQCLAIAGMPHYDDGPTVHSLRHSFAIQNLVKWGAEGKDINAMLPYLSSYMGHENLLGTERYLRMTSEMFPEIRERVDVGCSWLIPEVGSNEG